MERWGRKEQSDGGEALCLYPTWFRLSRFGAILSVARLRPGSIAWTTLYNTTLIAYKTITHPDNIPEPNISQSRLR